MTPLHGLFGEGFGRPLEPEEARAGPMGAGDLLGDLGQRPIVTLRIPMKAASDSDGKAATHSDPKRPLFQRSDLAGVIVCTFR